VQLQEKNDKLWVRFAAPQDEAKATSKVVECNFRSSRPHAWIGSIIGRIVKSHSSA
jgi:hypothetical protein